MRPHLLGVDHVVILIDDIDAAEAAWSRLGFNLTPRGFHSIGTQNHCMMFGSDYLELLSVIRPHPVTEYFSAFLAQGDGAAAVAFSTDDSQACCRWPRRQCSHPARHWPRAGCCRIRGPSTQRHRLPV